MRVQLINAAGLEEAGVDGGGMFREVLSELIHTAFDPNRGFFRLAQDRSLYPNPGVGLIVEDFQKHYFFIGRLLGKVSLILIIQLSLLSIDFNTTSLMYICINYRPCLKTFWSIYLYQNFFFVS